MDKVEILLSTYNGSKYITDLLNSISKLNHDNFDIELFIRDDGSEDNTVEIIKKILNKYKIVYKIEQGNNIGWIKSFSWLINNSGEADFYAYCDQDDVWCPDKIKKSILELKKINDKKPALYCSNVIYTDNNLNRIGKSENPTKYYLIDQMIKCKVLGCTEVINNSCMVLLKKYRNNYIAHDWWTMCCCLYNHGTIISDQETYILYRRHENNSSKAGYKAKTRLFDQLNKHHYRSIMAKQLYSKENTNDLCSQFIRDLANYKENAMSYFRLVLGNRYYKNISFKEKIMIKAYIAIGLA